MHNVAGCPFYSYHFHIELPSAATKWGANYIPFCFGIQAAEDILLLQNMLLVHFSLTHLLHLCWLRINCYCSDLVEITFRLPEAVAHQMDQFCISLIPRQPQWVQQVHSEVIKNQIHSLSFLQGYVQSVTHASLFFSHSYSLYYTSALHSFQFSHKHQLKRRIL